MMNVSPIVKRLQTVMLGCILALPLMAQVPGTPAALTLVQTIALPGVEVASIDGAVDTDDLFYDALRKRVYMSGGDGFVRVFAQRDADHYELAARVPTGPGARISIFVSDWLLPCSLRL